MKAILDMVSPTIPVMEIPIDPSVSVKRGQLLALNSGLATPSAANRSTAVLGVALETHTGQADLLDPRADGDRIRVAAGPHTVYSVPAPVLTTTDGSETTVVASGMSAYSNDDLNGWTLILRSKGEDSANPDPIGTVYKVTDFVASTKTLTVEGPGGAVSAGDSFWAFPFPGPLKGLLNAGRDGLTLSGGTAVNLPLQMVAADPDRRELLITPLLHEFGNKRS